MSLSFSSSKESLVFPVRDLNVYLGCKICHGYFREAHTLTECLHTFCRVCINKEFQKSGKSDKSCPICHVSLGFSPKIMFDRTIQAIVDKIFPEFSSENDTAGLKTKYLI
jgi:E3 ubiquitin-protein ligase DRIP